MAWEDFPSWGSAGDTLLQGVQDECELFCYEYRFSNTLRVPCKEKNLMI